MRDVSLLLFHVNILTIIPSPDPRQYADLSVLKGIVSKERQFKLKIVRLIFLLEWQKLYDDCTILPPLLSLNNTGF